MLPPLQQTSGLIVSDVLRSMLEGIEARRQEEQDKANGTEKQDKPLVEVKSDPVSIAANEKINAFFFGAMKQDTDPFATLVARFSSELGVEQGSDESNFSFARRLNDALALTRFDKSDSQGNLRELSLKSLGVTSTEVIDVLKNGANSETAPAAALAARLASAAELTGGEQDFDVQIRDVLMQTRGKLPENQKTLEEDTGLKDLGISAETMIAAIANPWSDSAKLVKNALEEQSENTKAMTRETLKILQRLEEVADPKTTEELKAERGQDKAGEINDAEVEAEREQNIRNRDATDKLEDVQELQDAVKEHNDQSNTTTEPMVDGLPVSVDPEIAMIQILAAMPAEDKADNDNLPASEDAVPTLEASSEAEQMDEAEQLLAATDLVDNEQDGILPISIDDNGLYYLLLKEAA